MGAAPASGAVPSIGDVLVELAAAPAGEPGGEAAWIKIAPAGTVRTRDGRTFSFDPAALAARFVADGVDVAVDVDHAAARAFLGGQAPAVGWIKALEGRPDGLYGRVDWLDEGKAILAARSRRYLSPTFPHDDLGNATWIHSVSLVATPALPNMPALAGASPTTPLATEPAMKTVLAALGLVATATEAEALAALTALQGRVVDLSAYVRKDVHEATLAQLTAATATLDGIRQANRKTEIEAVLEGALTAKKILPAQREAYAALCATEEGLAQVKALIAASPAMLGASGLDRQPTPGAAAGALTAQQLAICEAMGLDPEAYRKSLAAA
ncbi:phage protease [Prosthecomicrobium hirschii]|uniref:phage protease n=1 Tax=Prosthecodimorpha hirschii TaxID=665126 RepID=UPI00221E7FBB|nr:phage protease [Prosthecomicrobium hirschii]MCW1842292.1 phage protease [Prosthecomicrobium hirschii]